MKKETIQVARKLTCQWDKEKIAPFYYQGEKVMPISHMFIVQKECSFFDKEAGERVIFVVRFYYNSNKIEVYFKSEGNGRALLGKNYAKALLYIGENLTKGLEEALKEEPVYRLRFLTGGIEIREDYKRFLRK